MQWQSNLLLISEAWQSPGFYLIVSQPEHSILFWYYVRQKLGCKIIGFPTQAAEFSAWSGQLSQSFLGASEVYWCVIPAVGGKSSKMRQQCIDFLKKYTGPHAVWALIAEEQAGEFVGNRRFSVPARVKGSDIELISSFISMDRSSAVVRSLALVPPQSEIFLDTAVSVLWHAGYVPMRSPHESLTFLQTLLPHEVTLSQLAESFFKGNGSAFLSKWREVSGNYGDMFWISFWAELLWRAYWVRWYMKRGQQTRARTMTYRLPASFIQSGWKAASNHRLFAQYQLISSFDSGVKSGSFFTIDEIMTQLLAV